MEEYNRTVGGNDSSIRKLQSYKCDINSQAAKDSHMQACQDATMHDYKMKPCGAALA